VKGFYIVSQQFIAIYDSGYLFQTQVRF